MLKVLFTIPNFDSAGSGQALFQLAFGLKQQGFDVHFMTKHNRGKLVHKIYKSKIPLHVFEFESTVKPFIKFVKDCWRTSRVFKKINPNIIYSYHYSADYSEPFSAFLAGIPWVYVKKNMSWYGPSKNSWFIRSLIARKIIVQNTEMEKEFLFRFSKKLIYIPIGVDTATYKPSNARKCDDFTFIHVSSLLPVKGLDILLYAYRLFLEEVSIGHQLLIIGPNDSEYVKDLILQFKSITSIKFLGKRLNISELLNRSHCFIQSSLNEGRREGAPIALQEAMSSGLVCLGSRVAGINDQLRGFVNLQYESKNPYELKDRMLTVFNMSDIERQDVGHQLRQRVLDCYSLEKEIDKIMLLLNQLK